MKVLTITEGYPPDRGGGSTYAYEIPRRISRYGVKTNILTKSADVEHSEEKNPNVEVTRIEFPKYKKSGCTVNLKRIKFVLKILRIASKIGSDYDVIHLHSGFGTKIVAWGLRNIYRSKTPIVMTFHGTFIGNYDTFYPYPISDIFNFVSKGLMVGSNCDRYIVVDDGTHADDVLDGLVPDAKVKKHYHAVDCDTFRPEKIERDEKIITFIGRLDPFKGIELFIDAIPEIYESYNDVKFKIVGGGDLLDKLKIRVNRLGIEDNVEFVGSVKHSKIPYYMNLSDCLVFPDIRAFENRDYFNLAMAEAMACGSLFLSSSYPREKWGNSWVPIKNPDSEEISEKILNILENPRKYDDIKENARKMALEFFDWDKIIKLYYDEFESLVR